MLRQLCITKRKHWQSIYLFFLVSVLLFVVSVEAQDDDTSGETIVTTPASDLDIINACIPADVVLVIDTSSSTRTTDPDSLRVDAAQSIIDALYLNAAIDCENIVTHRIAAVGFGDEISLLIDPTEIFVSDASTNAWETEAQTLKQNLAQATARSIGGQTRVARALIGTSPSAQSIFETWSNTLTGDSSQRQQVIFLMTDGAPCTPIASSNNVCGNGSWVHHYFFANEESIYPFENWEADGFDSEFGLISALDALDNDIKFNVFLFSDDPDTQVLGGTGDAWRQITNVRQGVYEFVDPDNFANITQEINSIILDVLDLNVVTLACDRTFYLEPYRSATTIISSVRPSVDSNIQIIDPTDNEVNRNATNVEYLRLDTIERYIITNPLPGAWHIKGDPILCETIEPTLQTSVVEASIRNIPSNVVVELDAPYTAENSDAYVEINLMDRRFSAPFESNGDFPINICLRVTGPIDSQVILNPSDCISMSPISGEIGVWRSDTPVPAPRRGNYTITINGTVNSVDPARNGEELPVFSLESTVEMPAIYDTADPIPVELRVNVINAQRINDESYITALNIIESGQRLHDPIDVSVQVVQTNTDIIVPLEEIFRSDDFSDLEDVIIVDMVGPNPNNSITDSLTLIPDSDGLTFSGVLRENRGEMANTELDPEGDYQINFRLSNNGITNYNTQNYSFVSDAAVSITLDRLPLQGVGFITTPDTELSVLLNTVDDTGTRLNNPINIRVQLINQNGDLLSVNDVFGDQVDVNGLVEARLKNPEGIEIESINLRLISGSDHIFEGSFQNNPGTTFGNDGEYAVEVYFQQGVTLSVDSQDDFLLLTTSDRPYSFTVHRHPRYGVSIAQHGLEIYNSNNIEIQNTPDPSGRLFPLNIVPDENTQEPVTYIIKAQLIAPDGRVYTSDEITNMLAQGSSKDGMISATISGPNNIERTLSLTYNETENIFTQDFTTLGRDADIDPEGEYIIRYQIDPLAFNAEALAAYQIVEGATSVRFERQEHHGLRLEMRLLGSRANPATNTHSIMTVPLYLTWTEALGIPLVPGDATPQDVPFELVILDTNNQEINWNDILINNALIIADNNDGISDTTGDNAEDTEEPALPSSSIPGRTPVLSDIIRVEVTSLETNETLEIVDLQLVENGNNVRIIGKIDNEASNDGNYRIDFALLNPDGIWRSNYTNFSNEKSNILFDRKITNTFLNPNTWVFIEIVIDLILVFLLINIVRLNFLSPVGGTIIVTFRRLKSEKTEIRIRLSGGLKVFFNRRSKSFSFNNGTYSGKIRVRKIGSISRRAQNGGEEKVTKFEVILKAKKEDEDIMGNAFVEEKSRSPENLGGMEATVRHEY